MDTPNLNTQKEMPEDAYWSLERYSNGLEFDEENHKLKIFLKEFKTDEEIMNVLGLIRQQLTFGDRSGFKHWHGKELLEKRKVDLKIGGMWKFEYSFEDNIVSISILENLGEKHQEEAEKLLPVRAKQMFPTFFKE